MGRVLAAAAVVAAIALAVAAVAGVFDSGGRRHSSVTAAQRVAPPVPTGSRDVHEIQCLADTRSSTGSGGFSNCSPKVPGLDTTIGVLVSADGRNVYTTSELTGELTTFARRPNGTLRELGCFSAADYRPDLAPGLPRSSCTATAPGIYGTVGEQLTPDGRWLYVTAIDDQAVSWWRRDLATGRLTWAGCISSKVVPGCAKASSDGLDGARSVALSPDGRNAYVASLGHAVAALARNPATGALTELPGKGACIKSAENLPGSGEVNSQTVSRCPTAGEALSYNRQIVVSPDGRSAYSTDNYGDAIAEFSRDTNTGALTEVGCIADVSAPEYTHCAHTAKSLASVFAVTVSADGRYVFAAGQGDAVTVLARDPTTSELTVRSCVSDPAEESHNRCGQTAENLIGLDGLSLSPDGSQLWVAAFGDTSAATRFGVTGFAVHGSTLTPLGCVRDLRARGVSCANSADGLYQVRSVAFSPDGRNMYANSSVADTLAVFAGSFGRAAGGRG